MTRRQALGVIGAGLPAMANPAISTESLRARLPHGLPPGVAVILARFLSQQPQSINTDWFGTMPMLAALQWRRRGITEAEPFAKAWLTYHRNSQDVAKYSGSRARVVRAGGIPLTTYAGHFGMSQVCEEMAAQFDDAAARTVAQDLAAIVLHRTARNRLGLIGHDDMSDFAIPDVTFFAVSSLMIGASLDPKSGAAFRDQALYQLRTSIDTFLMKDTSLAKTLFRNDGPGKTYWTRASGWLLWSITAMLRRLDGTDPAAVGFRSDLKRLVDGMMRVQEPDGGFHVLLDDPSTPLDATGPAMFALGVHESVRRGWLPESYQAAAEKGWSFVSANLTGDGTLKNTYADWALPAENREMRVKTEDSGWTMGFVLSCANEITL